MRAQLQIAQRKIQNYKDKMLEKVDIIRKLELELAQSKTEAPQLLENDSLAESFSSVQKENIELLQKLQKAELELAKYREKSLNISDNSQIVIPDKEVIANTIKERPVTSEDQDKRIKDKQQASQPQSINSAILKNAYGELASDRAS